jgi:hypothetical protein
MIAHPDIYLNSAVHEPLARTLDRIYAPRTTLSARQWAEDNIVLTPEESRDRPGPYRATPAAARLLQFLNNPTEREFIPRKSSQPGITLSALLGICYRAATAPTHVLYAMDSAKEATRISTRLKRLLTTNAALDGTFQGDGTDDLQNLIMHLQGMEVWFVGSAARGGFANKSAGIVVLDELDLHLPDPDQDVDSIDRARERLKKVTDSKLIAGGKPESWLHPTNKNFLTGTREEIHVPCPRCGQYQPVRFEQLRFDHCKDLVGDWDIPAVMTNTFLECELCRGRIDDHEKPAMLREHRWVVTNLGEDKQKPYPGRVSIWVNDLTETDPKSSWGNIAAQYIEAQTSPSKLTTFFHGVLARPAEEKKTELAAEDIRKLCGAYARGTMPVAPASSKVNADFPAVFLAVDKQAMHYRWSKVGFTSTGESFVIDYGHTVTLDALFAIADEPIWINCAPVPADELDRLQQQNRAAGGHWHATLRAAYPDRPFVSIRIGIIDEGFATWDIRAFCHASQQEAGVCAFYSSKGMGTVTGRSLVEVVDNKFRTTQDGSDVQGPLVTVYQYVDDGMKQDLYLGRITQVDKIKAGASRFQRLWLPRDPGLDQQPPKADEDFAQYLDELCQEHRGLDKRRRMVWLDPKGCNDAGDTVKIALVLWYGDRHLYTSPPAVAVPSIASATEGA